MKGESVGDVGRRVIEQLWGWRSQPGSVIVASLSALLVTLIIVYVVQAQRQRKRLPPGSAAMAASSSQLPCGQIRWPHVHADGYYGDGVTSNEQGRKEIQEMLTRMVALFSRPIISDYVPWLSFVPKLQGAETQFQDARAFTITVTDKLIEKQKHHGRAEERRQRQSKPDYVPDFIDVLMQTKLENGQYIPDEDLNVFFMVSIDCNRTTTRIFYINPQFC